jgi:hypothetical protein
VLIFIAWRADDPTQPKLEVDAVAARLEDLFEPLLAERPHAERYDTAVARVAWIELPTEGWHLPEVERAGGALAIGPDPSMNIDALLAEHGETGSKRGRLFQLAEALERSPEEVLAELIPPASLLWSDGATHLTLQNDGLGQAQLFEYEAGGVTVVSNRLTAIRALGVALEPDADEWAVRMSLGWFPMESTGYRGVRFVGPGTRLRFTQSGIFRETYDVLTRWVNPAPLSPADCVELAAASFRAHIESAMRSWTRPSVGLSGGWDSRAVVGVMRDLGSDMSLRVRGSPDRYDVMIAAELARIADLDLRIKNKGGVPADDVEGCERSIRNALRWQSGQMEPKKHKTFLARKPHLPTGVVNVMGQHAGLGKADFVMKIKAWELSPDRYEDVLVDTLAGGMEPRLNPARREHVREVIRATYRQADRYGLEDGYARLHFFFLYEYTRRWGSVATSSQPGVVVTPYLNPGFIRGAYAFPQSEIRHRAFHKHLHATYCKDWAHVPLEDQATEEDVKAGRIRPVELKGKNADFHKEEKWKKGRRYGKFSNFRYWRDVARPLLDRARAAGGFWPEVLDPALAQGEWEHGTYRKVADPLVVAHLAAAEVEDD